MEAMEVVKLVPLLSDAPAGETRSTVNHTGVTGRRKARGCARCTRWVAANLNLDLTLLPEWVAVLRVDSCLPFSWTKLNRFNVVRQVRIHSI